MAFLLGGALTAPSMLGAATAAAAECQPSVATYVLEVPPGPVLPVKSTSRTLRKYLDWEPKSGDANGTFLDTEQIATVPGDSRFFSAGSGVIYEITGSGTLKSYKDLTASGGSLLSPGKIYDLNWKNFQKLWAAGKLLFGQAESGEITVYSQSDPTTGSGTVSEVTARIPATSAGAVAIKNADDVWAAGKTIYTLTDGEIQAWPYTSSETLSSPPRVTRVTLGTPTVIVTGLTDAVQAWSPGPGTVNTSTGSRDYSGTVKGYTGTNRLTLANAEIGTGIYGQIFADTAECLADATGERPYFGTPPEDLDVPAAVSESDPEPEPQDARTVSGRFVRGDGQPAAGLEVVVEAGDLVPDEEGASTAVPILGKTTTREDGSWSFTIPSTLPAKVQDVVQGNGGTLNVTATATGVTSTGVIMSASEFTTAVPESASSALQASVAEAASEEAPEPTALLPQAPDDPNELEPAEFATAESWASIQDKYTVDTIGSNPLPEWQSPTGSSLSGYNPYMVNGTDVSGMKVTPYLAGCEKRSKTLKKYIKYTTVAEGHAFWDTKASVDYDEKTSTNIEVAYSTPNGYKISGSVNVGNSFGYSTGYTNQGPFFAKQWKVPIEYKKVKVTLICGGKSVSHKEIRANRYKVPAGGATGKYGKDVRKKDGGSRFSLSPKKNRAYVAAGAYFQLSKGRSVKFGAAVTLDGISVGASTQLDREHKQRITAGNKTSDRHYIWGKNGPVSGKPGVFYSY
ncbi:hypothetical protein [Streptomyces europaeiscabiei]|uniref:hypothetical protein n=1 Tax=Streptomyces europaeiscabiei TaxID=146819 RepID=UPI0038F7671E